MNENQLSKIYTVLSVFILGSSFNALCAIQNWKISLADLLSLTKIESNWEATIWASVVLLPGITLIIILGLAFAKMNTGKNWAFKIPTMWNMDIDSNKKSGKVYKLSVFSISIIIPLMLQIIVTNKFFYGTVYKNGIKYSYGYFYNEKRQPQKGHLTPVQIKEVIEAWKTNKFKYDNSLNYIPFWSAWLLIILNLTVLLFFIYYKYIIFSKINI